MSTWLFNVYIDGVVQEVNTGVLGEWLELLRENGGRFQLKPAVIFAEDTTLMAQRRSWVDL